MRNIVVQAANVRRLVSTNDTSCICDDVSQRRTLRISDEYVVVYAWDFRVCIKWIMKDNEKLHSNWWSVSEILSDN